MPSSSSSLLGLTFSPFLISTYAAHCHSSTRTYQLRTCIHNSLYLHLATTSKTRRCRKQPPPPPPPRQQPTPGAIAHKANDLYARNYSFSTNLQPYLRLHPPHIHIQRPWPPQRLSPALPPPAGSSPPPLALCCGGDESHSPFALDGCRRVKAGCPELNSPIPGSLFFVTNSLIEGGF
ncbi:uncharacterized protein B0I36DRAFT_147561 [Microdochium trichocladiopsis]|uniref:Uncharacterized protein n=1 Tax=Microdochium trichocladiopsis TaxID=1682393 RepID=A0A9P8Y5W7_9PEZI|nr:uncharacterized protein B0I36DRAFT_147561 [Microdochium trichocladiopsis]KAH7028161.1 hypothetical protein B0I36DRAFT_147561 [Microdochium trichocladiopsis]